MPKIFSDEEKQFHKNFLLDNGLRVIMENGYKHVTVDQLVQMIGASKGYFYLLFPSRIFFWTPWPGRWKKTTSSWKRL